MCLLAKKIKILGKPCNPWCCPGGRRRVRVVGSHTTAQNLTWYEFRERNHVVFASSSLAGFLLYSLMHKEWVRAAASCRTSCYASTRLDSFLGNCVINLQIKLDLACIMRQLKYIKYVNSCCKCTETLG